MSDKPAVRAKFRVMNRSESFQGADTVRLRPVIGPCHGKHDHNADANEGLAENLSFWEATPGGEIELLVDNREAWEKFEVGKAYYIDFTPAPG